MVLNCLTIVTLLQQKPSVLKLSWTNIRIIAWIAFRIHFKEYLQQVSLRMASQILKRILYLLFLLFLCEWLVFGTALSQKTTVDECDCCKLLKTVINKQNEISQQNRNLEKKFDLLFGATANCSEGKRLILRWYTNLDKKISQQSLFLWIKV